MRDCPDRVGAEGSAQTSGAVGASCFASVVMRPTGRGTPAAAGRGRGRGGDKVLAVLRTVSMLLLADRTRRRHLM